MRVHVYTYGSEREIAETEVGGPLPPGTRGLRNNRILVRGASCGKDVPVKKKRSSP